MASIECIDECLTILRLMKGDPWEKGHAAFYGVTLKQWPDEVARAVVNKCADTLKFRPSRAELLDALQSQDGRPGPEEAWAMIPKSEDATAVWTQEMSEAALAAQPLLDEGDKVAARMAFKERYSQLVSESRAAGTPVNWQVSLGFDKAGREGPIREAIQKGRLTAAFAQQYLPAIEETQPRKQIESGEPVAMPAEVRALIGSMKPVDQVLAEKPKLRIEEVA